MEVHIPTPFERSVHVQRVKNVASIDHGCDSISANACGDAASPKTDIVPLPLRTSRQSVLESSDDDSDGLERKPREKECFFSDESSENSSTRRNLEERKIMVGVC